MFGLAQAGLDQRELRRWDLPPRFREGDVTAAEWDSVRWDPEELVPRVRHTGKQRPDVAPRREVWPESVAGSQGTDEELADVPLPGLEESERLVSEGAGEASDVSYERRRRTIEKELEAHRRRGHFPFDARCESCRMNKSVTRHPRKTLKGDPG